MTNDSFAEAFFNEFPTLREMDWSNVVLRGGAIIDLLLQKPVHDLDFYFYGFQPGDDAAILRRAEAFLTYLLEVERNYVESLNRAQQKKRDEISAMRGFPPSHHYAGMEPYYVSTDVKRIDIKGVRRGAVITVQLSAIKVPLQLVLIQYDSKESMSSTVDIKATGAIFDGQDVWLSQEAKWELENMTIRVEKGRYPHPSRLKRYFQKGFDICLPELDVTKIPRAYIDFGWNLVDAIRTPSLGFSYSAVDDKRITVESFFDVAGTGDSKGATMSGKYGGGSGRRISRFERSRSRFDDSSFDSKSVLYGNILVLAELCRRNAQPPTAAAATGNPEGGGEEDARVTKKPRLVAAAHNKEEEPCFSVYAEADFIKDVLKPWPDLTSRQVENTYLGIITEIYRDQKFNFDAYNEYVTVVPLSDTLDRIKTAPNKALEAVTDAVSTQMAATNALIVHLRKRFEGALPPVHSMNDAFHRSLQNDAFKFYGPYRLEE